VGRATTATAQPAQYGFNQPNCMAIPKTETKARAVLMASLNLVIFSTEQSVQTV